MLKNLKIIVCGLSRPPHTGIWIADQTRNHMITGADSKQYEYDNIDVSRQIEFDELSLPIDLQERFSDWVGNYTKAFNSTSFAIHNGRDIDEIGQELCQDLVTYLDSSVELFYVDKYLHSHLIKK